MKATVESLELQIIKLQNRLSKLKKKKQLELQEKCVHNNRICSTYDDWYDNGENATTIITCVDCLKELSNTKFKISNGGTNG